ncbi:hypothetical protein ACTOB_006336 [Actinoplanes oblitus]|uniref:Uncharacterized protein n=1 Tax=Actinoplanes oblitus TaxID=3040509 RepID=A0ABY8WD40_9ACTN|nr:hypothetical protein [Actinoplanes oblitus]WIM94319.1 hypothetical protein ACTOB_006336 [Actinoplanes oblitus]
MMKIHSTGGTVTYRLRRSGMVLRMLTIAPLVLLVGSGLAFALLSYLGKSAHFGRAMADIAPFLALSLAGATGSTVIGRAGRRLARVRVSDSGIEFARTRHAALFVPWAAVRSVRRRYAGPLTELVITPDSVDSVIVTQRGAPVQRAIRRAGAPAFVVDIGMIRPGAAALLADISGRLTPEAGG